MAELPQTTGDALVPVQLSPCVGGLLRTWTEGGTQLWSVPDDSALVAAQGTGVLARVDRGQQRFRETALLDEAGGLLVLQPRAEGGQLPATTVKLEPAGEARADAPQEFARAINQAVRHVASTFEYLVLDVGGWDAPFEPFVFFALHVDEQGNQLSTIEASPAPQGSKLWEPHIRPGVQAVAVNAPVSQEAIDMAAYYLADAVVGMQLLPWDVAFTFGVREG